MSDVQLIGSQAQFFYIACRGIAELPGAAMFAGCSFLLGCCLLAWALNRIGVAIREWGQQVDRHD
jgi:hypothetical protein